MRPQLAHLQPDPGVVRFLLSSPLRIFQCFFQPAAVHQRYGIAVVPGSAACGVLLGILHPLSRLVVVDIIVNVITGKSVPEGDLQILVRLFFGKSSFFHAIFDEIFQPLQHSPEVTGNSFIEGFQRFNIFC